MLGWTRAHITSLTVHIEMLSTVRRAHPCSNISFLLAAQSERKKNDEKMEKFLQKISDSVGAQLHGMNSSIVKMKEEGDDRYKQISERFTKYRKANP